MQSEECRMAQQPGPTQLEHILGIGGTYEPALYVTMGWNHSEIAFKYATEVV